jgi:hypothetical protein
MRNSGWREYTGNKIENRFFARSFRCMVILTSETKKPEREAYFQRVREVSDRKFCFQ